MASAKDIRRRIKTVKNIQQITQAMKLVASARLQKAQSRVHAARPFADKIQEIIAHLSASATELHHPLMEVRPEKRIALIVIGADRGLAGSYHTNIVRITQRFLTEHQHQNPRLFVLGKKGAASIKRLGPLLEGARELPGTDVQFVDIRPLSQMAQKMYTLGEVDAVYVIYTEFRSAISQHTLVQRLLPVEPPSNDDNNGSATEYLFEPAPEELLGSLLSRYVDTQLFRAVLESVTSEQGARMTAMNSATNNANEMIDRLTLSLNRARQAAITTEISEIVGTAEALK
ncbi:MAG: ATP synthase F1 subunit gamma [Armatimonadetes bacterium]|nr:ATP synthase F1 subunit gamma [Armatimonadota bacterium]